MHRLMRADAWGRAGAMGGGVVVVYIEIHRLGKLTVNHTSN